MLKYSVINSSDSGDGTLPNPLSIDHRSTIWGTVFEY